MTTLFIVCIIGDFLCNICMESSGSIDEGLCWAAGLNRLIIINKKYVCNEITAINE